MRLRLVLTSSQRFLDQGCMGRAPLCDVVELHYLAALDAAGLAHLLTQMQKLRPR